jgi:tetratricopeptide (TPR) repeat protein
MLVQLTKAEAARLKRSPAANSGAEDLALQCDWGQMKGGYIGKEADAAYSLCEQALAIDPNNVHALNVLGVKLFMPVGLGPTDDPKASIKRADEFVSRALALDPEYTWAHLMKGNILQVQGRTEEAVAEHERALALNPSAVDAYANMGFDYPYLGQPDTSLEMFDKAIAMSPYDPALVYWYGGKAWAYFEL